MELSIPLLLHTPQWDSQDHMHSCVGVRMDMDLGIGVGLVEVEMGCCRSRQPFATEHIMEERHTTTTTTSLLAGLMAF